MYPQKQKNKTHYIPLLLESISMIQFVTRMVNGEHQSLSIHARLGHLPSTGQLKSQVKGPVRWFSE